jgi:hypothetical protein
LEAATSCELDAEQEEEEEEGGADSKGKGVIGAGDRLIFCRLFFFLPVSFPFAVAFCFVVRSCREKEAEEDLEKPESE